MKRPDAQLIKLTMKAAKNKPLFTPDFVRKTMDLPYFYFHDKYTHTSIHLSKILPMTKTITYTVSLTSFCTTSLFCHQKQTVNLLTPPATLQPAHGAYSNAFHNQK